MPELSEQSTDILISSFVMNDDLATAPGDLPVHEIRARAAARRTQFRHDNTIIPSYVRTGQAVEVWSSSGEDVPLEGATLFYTTDGSFPDLAAKTIPCERVHISWDLQAGYLTHWRAVVSGQQAQTVVRYRIGGWRAEPGPGDATEPDLWAQDGQGVWFHFSGSRAITTFAYSVEDEAISLPAWAQEAVIYHIFLDRFRTSAPDGGFPTNTDHQQFHGGTLRGVCDALPYLSSLGITCLWLSPLYLAESYHRYDATDFYSVDPRLGTNDDLKKLTDQAHALGMRVLLDFVPSHFSWHHPAFVSAQQDRDAPSFAWFSFDDWPNRYKCFLDIVPSLVTLDGSNDEARAYIIGSAVQWLHDYGVDGFRLDHAIGQGMDFWTAFQRATREVADDAITIGEVTDTPDSLVRYRGKLDYILDFPLASALRHAFGLRDWDVQQLDHFLFAYTQFMTTGPGRVSFLDNHDMERFLFVAGNDPERLKMAALCQFTLEPLPTIYYGTEVGLSQQTGASDPLGGGDAQFRLDMVWEQSRWNHDLLNFYRALIKIRKELPVLQQGQHRTIHLDQAQHTYGYVRTSSQQGALTHGDVAVLFNLSEQCQLIPLQLGWTLAECRTLLSTGAEPLIKEARPGLEVLLAPGCGTLLYRSCQ